MRQQKHEIKISALFRKLLHQMISVNNNSCKVTQMVRPALKDDFSKECDYCKGTGVSKVNKIACEGYVFKPFQTDDLMSKEYLIECPICKGRGVKTE